jgi:hypothetical protein
VNPDDPAAADVLVPVPTPWRYVSIGDTFRAPNGGLWQVWTVETVFRTGHLRVVAAHNGQLYGTDPRNPILVDPDEQIPVLIPMPEHIALSVLRENLAAAHIAGKTRPTEVSA